MPHSRDENKILVFVMTSDPRYLRHRQPKLSIRSPLDVTLAYKRCCVTKIRFIRVCMGTQWFCFKSKKLYILWIKLTYPDFVFHSLLFASFSGRSNAISASYRYLGSLGYLGFPLLFYSQNIQFFTFKAKPLRSHTNPYKSNLCNTTPLYIRRPKVIW